MSKQEAREILALYRPGTADEKDPAFDQARQLAKTDPELACWSTNIARLILSAPEIQAIPIPPG